MRKIVIMGPSGSGKSAVARRLGPTVVDADDLHPQANIDRMSAGLPLRDEDRWPWLDKCAAQLGEATDDIVLACSALARRYRDRILKGAPDVLFVELVVSRETLRERMTGRSHFMPGALLDSQIDTWERLMSDEPGFSVDGEQSLEDITAHIAARLAEG